MVCCLPTKAGTITRNQSVGTANAGLKGYHETITTFWVEEINDLYQRHKHLSFDEIYDLLLSTPKFSDKHYIKHVYGNDILKTTKASTVCIRPEYPRPS